MKSSRQAGQTSWEFSAQQELFSRRRHAAFPYSRRVQSLWLWFDPHKDPAVIHGTIPGAGRDTCSDTCWREQKAQTPKNNRHSGPSNFLSWFSFYLSIVILICRNATIYACEWLTLLCKSFCFYFLPHSLTPLSSLPRRLLLDLAEGFNLPAI